MPSMFDRARSSIARLALLLLVGMWVGACGPGAQPLLPRSQTWAELRTVRRSVTVTPPGESERAPYPRERLVDGEAIQVSDEGLAWLRRDGGATLLVRGPAKLVVRAAAIEITDGRVFIDTPPGVTAEIATPSGPLSLSHVRASIDVSAARGATEAYVLAGEVKAGVSESATQPIERREATGTVRAAAGERLVVTGRPGAAKASVEPALSWEDWTGGLATTDRAAEPSPFGIGTVGARRPGNDGAPHSALAIQKLDVRVSIDGDFALTEVDEVFFNPTSEVVEGVYRFRTPDGATLHRFGVDRGGALVWGRVKEKQAAEAQYRSNVYQGSKEDPALLEWDAPGVYRARLYPILPGEARRVVVQYGEWLSRTGSKGGRRLYVYPMAAEGAETSLPHIEELTIAIDMAKSGAKEVRAGMAGVRDGNVIIVREQDTIPRADLALELFDDGLASPRIYTAPHAIDLDALPPAERADARERAKTEADYVLVPLRPDDMPLAKGGLDLAVVVDTSAATDPGSLAIARAATAALLSHMGKNDRAGVWAGDASLRAVAPGQDKLMPIDKAAREAILTHLASIERGGATDLGAMLSQAAGLLDPSPERRGAVVYIGDGAPTVGEMNLSDLRDRMAKLPRPVRIFSLGVGDSADMAVLSGLARGASAERIGDANTAARAALRLLEHAERPAWLSASIDLGPSIEGIFPRDLGAIVADESLLILGRVTKDGTLPATVTFTGPSGKATKQLTKTAIRDNGDLARRWAGARLAQMIDEGAGRAAMVDLGSRHGIITPVTSLYVPTFNEMSVEERAELEERRPKAESRSSKILAFTEDETPVETEKPPAVSPSKYNIDGVIDGKKREPKDTALPKAAAGVDLATIPAVPSAAPYPIMEPPSSTPAIGGKQRPAEAPPPPPEVLSQKGAPPAQRPARPIGGELDRGVSKAGDFDLPKADGRPSATTAGSGSTARGEEGRMGNPGVAGGGQSPPGYFQGQPAFEAGLENTNGWIAQDQPTIGNQHAQNEANNISFKNLEAKQGAKLPPGSTRVVIEVGEMPHAALLCGAAAKVPFYERIGLWRERLAGVGGNVWATANVYRTALALCEAPTWRERSKLLSMMLDATSTVARRVQLWRQMWGDLGATDALYRGILARIRTPQEARELHEALGLKTLDPGVLAKLLKDAKSPEDRAFKLRALVVQWPDDFTLLLTLLNALEDANDIPGARELARKLRARPDADARLRTAVGELYLRIAAKAASPEQKAEDEREARRAFGEIVEFAPDDPTARRRLGDLLRAHGWYADAARQYETLEKLAPDDSSVWLLMAAAAEGLGKLEEAVKWTEKGGAAGSPDSEQSPARTARAFAATYLAWGRQAAREAGRKDEEQMLKARAARVLAGDRGSEKLPAGARVSLVWSHPELHPTLWTNALGAPMPAPEGDVTLGIAQAVMPNRSDAMIEVRVEPDELPHAGRLGATATLTVVFDEGGEGEKIVKRSITFARDGRAVQRFAVSSGDVREVNP